MMVVARLGLVATFAASLVAASASLEPRVAAGTGTGIIVPLYFDPAQGTCYPEIAAAYAANPTIPWTLILNPNSGYSSTVTPMLACIPSLRAALPTANIIGYVPTGYGNALKARFVNTQITSWKSLTSKGLGVDGIFFDETQADSGNVTTYTTYSNNAKIAFGASTFIVMNPGLPVSNINFWNLANLIVTYEGTYANFKTAPLLVRGQVPSKSAILIHTIQPRNEAATTQTLVNSLVPTFGALYFTDLSSIPANANVYESLGSQFSTFVNQVGSKQVVNPCGKC